MFSDMEKGFLVISSVLGLKERTGSHIGHFHFLQEEKDSEENWQKNEINYLVIFIS